MPAPICFVTPDGVGPLPVSAVWTAPDTMTVTFDQALVPGPLQHLNWSADVDALEYECISAVAAGAIVTLDLGPIGAAPAGRRVTYAATPADVVSLATGTPAAAFADFPVT